MLPIYLPEAIGQMSDAVLAEPYLSSLDGLDDLEQVYGASTASTGVGPTNSYDWDWLAFSITHSPYFSPDSSPGEMSTFNENTYPESLSASVSTSVTLDQDRPHLPETSSFPDPSNDMDHFLHMQSLNASSNNLSDTSWELPVSEAHQKDENDMRPSLPPPSTSGFPSHPALSAFDHFSGGRTTELGGYQSAVPFFGANATDFGLGLSEDYHGVPAAGPALQASLAQPSLQSIYSSRLTPRGLVVPHNSPDHFHQYEALNIHPQGHSPYSSQRALSERTEDLATGQTSKVKVRDLTLGVAHILTAYLDPASSDPPHHHRLSAPPQLAFGDEPHHYTPPRRPSSSDQNALHTSMVDHPSAVYQPSPFPRRRLARYDTPPIVPSMEGEGQFDLDQSSQFLDADSNQALSSASHHSARSASVTSTKVAPSSASQMRRRKREDSLKAGGRKRGSHLADGTKASAREMRDVVSCWRCVFQRDKVCEIGHKSYRLDAYF